MPRNNNILIRRGTSTDWVTTNPVLASGEPGFDTTNGILKIGNNSVAWTGLPVVGGLTGGSGNYVAKWTSSSGIGNSLIYDNGTNVGIGTTTPSAQLHVNGSGIFASGLNSNGAINLNNELYINRSGIFLGSSQIPAAKFSVFSAESYAEFNNITCNQLVANEYIYAPTTVDTESPGLFFATNGNGVAGIACDLDGQSMSVMVNTGNNSFIRAALFDNTGITSESITAEQKFFKIKHPNPESGYSYLQYGSLESPYNGVRLTGKDKLKNGICEVYLPDYLKHLIYEEDISIQLTNHGHHKILYVDKIDLKNNKFIIKGYRSKSGGPFNFYWSFTGIRKDVSILIPEQ